jgi:hypothetical protein
MYMSFGKSGLRPQDIVLLVKLLILDSEDWRMVDVADALYLSQGEVSKSLARLRDAGLLSSNKKQALNGAALEVLIHGVKYFFPVKPGPLGKGVKTSHSGPVLDRRIRSSSDYVWPHAIGDVRGEGIEPLYPEVPLAASEDPQLYKYLSLLDAIRVGRKRERAIATEEYKKAFGDMN